MSVKQNKINKCGLTFEPDQTLKNIATAQNLNPLDVLKVILVENHIF